MIDRQFDRGKNEDVSRYAFVRSRSFYWPFGVSLLATPVCLLLGLASAGVGHGDYRLAMVLFPFTMLSAFAFNSITIPFIIVAVIQFPLYGILVGFANVRHKGLVTAACILGIHSVGAITCLLLAGDFVK